MGGKQAWSCEGLFQATGTRARERIRALLLCCGPASPFSVAEHPDIPPAARGRMDQRDFGLCHRLWCRIPEGHPGDTADRCSLDDWIRS